ncbi:hypothetical protein B0T22DRAFT_484816 [Podospora appendiculata]|uniref:Uncharacterized protein n=1 Tax=Podospora appendiculata TaxID=314037 RepID=A0AAE0X1G2_9PEZI|nr:hypothetical protein B0T22DRAFT_484816 [Podospora appendiculata]
MNKKQGLNHQIGSYHPPITKTEGPKLGISSVTNERWRLTIHYNWTAQLVLLIKGLPRKGNGPRDKDTDSALRNLAMPSLDEIRAVSPYSPIILDHYQTP